MHNFVSYNLSKGGGQHGRQMLKVQKTDQELQRNHGTSLQMVPPHGKYRFPSLFASVTSPEYTANIKTANSKGPLVFGFYGLLDP